MTTTNNDIHNKQLKRRIIEISYKYKLSHIGSCLTAVDIIQEVYDRKRPEEPFVLSSGHAALALYTVIESKGGRNAEDIFNHHGVHPDRCADCAIDCSSGSLGHGLPIAVGMALSERSRNVYCLVSDGETSEGSIWEALRITYEQDLKNLKVYINVNGWGAYKKITVLNIPPLALSYITTKVTSVEQLPFLKGLDAHYHVMTKEEYKEALRILS